MVGKVLTLSLMLLANKSGNLTNNTLQMDRGIGVFTESQANVPPFQEGGDGMSSKLVPQSNETISESKANASENGYPRVFYTQDKDGSWECNGRFYKYRFELIGRNQGASSDGRFLVLTNDENITFNMVTKSFTSDDPKDRLDIKNTVVVEAGWY